MWVATAPPRRADAASWPCGRSVQDRPPYPPPARSSRPVVCYHAGMNAPNERVSAGVSRAELERRWTLAQARMQELGCEALVVQGAANTVGIGGHFRWFTGASALTSYPQTAIVPLHGAITLVAHGGLGSEAKLDGTD